MTDTQKNLTAKQLIGIEALIQGATNGEAAKKAGVTRATVSGWHKQPEFEAEIERQYRAILPAVSKSLVGRLPKVVDYLFSVVDDKKTSDTLKIRASLGLIDRAIRLIELTDILERLEALERTQ